MPVHDKDYWENFERSLFLTGKITQEAAYALSPRIKELRAASGDPITLYIDSPGGSSAVAEGIRFLIKAPDQDGRRCRLITVVIGTAASAAADLLALGDYAIDLLVPRSTRGADGGGFEPPVPFGTHALQACTINHSVTHPSESSSSFAS